MLMAPKNVVRRKWTRADLLRLPDDGNRYEVLDGQLFVTPQASVPHQWIAYELVKAILPYVELHRLGWVPAPGATIFDDNELQPDVMVIPMTSENLPKKWEKLPRALLVIEILSPTTRRRDLDLKRRAYLRLGIPEYWVVDRFDRRVLVWRPSADEAAVRTDTVTWRPMPERQDIPPLEIAVDRILPAGHPGPEAE